MKLSKIYIEFFDSERAGGILLICATVFSLLLANIYSPYAAFWTTEIGHHTLTEWINDLLMTFFFLLVGLEIEREIYIGELKEPGKAILPVSGAIGGMLIPAGIYLLFNHATNAINGFGIPMATDIAFTLAIIGLLGSKVPASIKIFITALAIIDDLGAIIVIALFYNQGFSVAYLLLTIALYLIAIGMNRYGVMRIWPYLIIGAGMWFGLLQCGVHPTLTGVLLAFAIPFRKGDDASPSYKLQHILHKPIALIILPVFALANTSMIIDTGLINQITSHQSLGIILGLVIGKPLGILLCTWLMVKSGFGKLPEGSNWKLLAGAGMLAGIGFTMSIFISILAFDDNTSIELSKLSVMMASLIAGLLGYLWISKKRES